MHRLDRIGKRPPADYDSTWLALHQYHNANTDQRGENVYEKAGARFWLAEPVSR